MKKLLILALIFLCLNVSAFGAATYPVFENNGNTVIFPNGSKIMKIDRKYGFYVDGRNQIPEYDRILPPHPENIPKEPHPVRTVEPFESYYDRNIQGIRRPDGMTQIIPNYNRFYSNRRVYPYTRAEYIDVWCDGVKNYEKGICTVQNYKYYFVKARDWSLAVTAHPFRAINARKEGKRAAIFIMVDDLGLDAISMSEAKEFAKTFGIMMVFGTIDSFIPSDNIV